MSTDAGCASDLELGGQRRGRDLRDHQPRLEAAVAREERRQPAQRRVDQPIAAPLADRGELRHARSRADRRRPRPARRGSCRPTRCRRCRRRPSGCRWPRWPRSSTIRRDEARASRAAPCTCGGAPHRVGVLHAAAVRVRRVDGAARQQPRDVGGRDARCPANGRASWMRASNGRVDPRRPSIESAAATSAARASRSASASASASTAADGCVPLMSARPSFGSSAIGVERRRPQRLGAGQPCAADHRLAFADEHQREVRERREVAARAHRAARGHDRVHAGVEQRDQRHRACSARMPEWPHASTLARSAIIARTARAGERLADAGRMAAQQVQLQRRQRVVRDAHLGERAEAGVDAVHRLVAVRLADRPRPAPRRRAPAPPAPRQPPRRRRRSPRCRRA